MDSVQAFQLAGIDAVGQAALVSAGEITAVELLDAAIVRLEAARHLNAVIADLFDRGRAQAADLDSQGRARAGQSGPLAGVPFLLKDLGASLAGTPEAMGSCALRTHVATETAWTVERYLSAGLVVFGKTNTPEWGNHSTTEPSLFGPSVNPWSPSITPGGSAAVRRLRSSTSSSPRRAGRRWRMSLAGARSRCRSAPRRTVCRSEFRSWRPMRRSCSNSPHSSKGRSHGYIGGLVCNVAAWCATFVR